MRSDDTKYRSLRSAGHLTVRPLIFLFLYLVKEMVLINGTHLTFLFFVFWVLPPYPALLGAIISQQINADVFLWISSQ